MPDWGGQRPGAGRKPKEPGKNRVSLSTRVSEKTSQQLRDYAQRAGKSLGEVLDDMVAFVAPQPTFEAYLTTDGEPDEAVEIRTADDLFNVPTLKDDVTVGIGRAVDTLQAIEVTVAGSESAALTTDEPA